MPEERVQLEKAPCDCQSFFCRPCREQMDFQSWLEKYSQLHADVGGRYCGSERPYPCPTRQDDPRFAEWYAWCRSYVRGASKPES